MAAEREPAPQDADHDSEPVTGLDALEPAESDTMKLLRQRTRELNRARTSDWSGIVAD
jgi:hypothetical protein